MPSHHGAWRAVAGPMRRILSGSVVVAALVAGGCAAPTDAGEEGATIDGESVGSVAQPVLAERPGEVEYAFRYYNDPKIARVQFAAPNWRGCSSTMIGPNFVLTAAHCGPAESEASQEATLMFMTYRANETQRNVENFRCRRLIHGWPRHDLAILYCPPNAAGVSPGEKYGYVDFETRAPVVGDSVYSIWWNPVTSGATGTTNVSLFSAGTVRRINEVIWDDRLGGPGGQPIGINMSTWTQPGSSGSSSISRTTNRILVGPTSTGSSPEGPSKNAWSMRTYLDTDVLAPGNYPGANFIENVKASNFPPGTWDFARYAGKVDRNQNAVFDVQEDIERAYGENTRATYWLGFDMRRRIPQWETGFVAIDYDAKETRIAYVGAGLALRHRFLNLKPNTTYRVGVRVKTNTAGNANALTVGFERSNQAAWSVAALATPAGTTGYRTALIRTDASPKPFFAIRSTGAFNGSVSEIELVEDGSTNNFELADQREGWTTGFLTPADFLPRGVTADSGGAPDFALALRTFGWGAVLPVSTNTLVFSPLRFQRLCFKVRSLDPTSASGVARITSGTTQVVNATFPLTTAWTQQCVNRISTPSTDTTLTFASSGTISTTYLVDDVKLEADPNVFTLPPGGIAGIGGVVR